MTKKKCAYCRRNLELGMDVFRVQQGVMGHRGFIPLEEKLIFCREECLRDYFNGLPIETERIP